MSWEFISDFRNRLKSLTGSSRGMAATICGSRIRAIRIKNQGPGAFTLIELLATTGGISLLMAMLLPAIQRGKESAKTVRCKSNLRQLGTALSLYVQEEHRYQGFYT